ncbi:hypothetical protein HWV00_12155 [Moritella sp. 24]|uniref:hypothetical protein n=1 Tax=Moritella sp. 24 TaxID=2746230 RepID=UPI001BA965BD|nr:hypothetical protein [Moritella sp. 24]QUM76931.1 hypothetical protein HWV00_12155 [Moritella sp. 24]
MNLEYWINVIFVLSLGVILVQMSHGKMIVTTKLNFSSNFLKVIRYIGLIVIVYSCYGVIIDYVIAS